MTRLSVDVIVDAASASFLGGGHQESALLASCYRRCIDIAATVGAETMAFPCISTGVYGYPIEAAARIAVATIRECALQFPAIREILFCCYSANDLAMYEGVLAATAA